MEKEFARIIESVGEDLSRPGLGDTPKRAAKAFEFMTRGYKQSLAEVVNDAIFPSDTDEMVVVSNIELYSLCEHHLLPFIGHAHVAYLPRGKVIGLSKVARIVDMYARRLQIQEKMTSEIANAIDEVLKPQGVGVVIEAEHSCMTLRGVDVPGASLTTSALLGVVRDDHRTREEFLRLVRG